MPKLRILVVMLTEVKVEFCEPTRVLQVESVKSLTVWLGETPSTLKIGCLSVPGEASGVTRTIAVGAGGMILPPGLMTAPSGIQEDKKGRVRREVCKRSFVVALI
jgi:hypothetical protein